MKLLIVLHHRFELWSPPPWVAQRLRSDFPDVEVMQFDRYEEAEPHLTEADALVTWSLRPEQILAANKLRWIHSPSAAVHQFMIPEIIDSPIVLTNASAVHGPVVAEHAIALMMALAKNLPSAVRYQQQRVWGQQQLWDERPHPREVAGATLGIVGFGTIGTEVARRALGLGMRVIATRQHPEYGVPVDILAFLSAINTPKDDTPISDDARPSVTVLSPLDINILLSESDYVLLSAPLRASTRALINSNSLLTMKPLACIINVGRGSLIDEEALADAVREGRIGGAALDVFEREPLPPDSQLWDLKNVLITPHSAALTDRLWDRHYKMISENIGRFLAGQPLMGVVDTRRGY